MLFEKLFLTLWCLVLTSCSLAQAEANVSSDSPVQQRFFSAPIVYDNNFETEHERFGYQLTIDPHPVSFSLDGRAYIRQKNGVVYMNTQGKWAFSSFLPVISSVAKSECSAIDMFIRNDLRIVFDKDGYAYTPVLAYLGKIKRPFLLVKPPVSEQWRAYGLPSGDPRIEWFSGVRMLHQPPAVLLYEDKTISIVNVARYQNKISISKPQEISKNVLAIARLGSGGSIVVRAGDWIHTVFAFDTAPVSSEGTPEMWARWSPQKNLKYPPQLLGMSVVFQSPAPDPLSQRSLKKQMMPGSNLLSNGF